MGSLFLPFLFPEDKILKVEATVVHSVKKELIFKREIWLALFSVAVLIGLSFFVTRHMLFGTFAYLCLFCGIMLRHQRKIHPKLMVLGMMTDVLLVLIIEIQRSAIKTSLEFSLTVAQQLHILFSLLAAIHYLPLFYLGFKLLRGTATAQNRKLHLYLGLMTFVFRTLGFLLMFAFLSNKPVSEIN